MARQDQQTPMGWNLNSLHARIKGKIIGALTRLPPRSSAHSSNTIMRVAEHLTQLHQSNFVSTRSVLLKNRKRIVYRIDVRLSDVPDGDPILQLVAKKTRHTIEARLYKHLISRRLRNESRLTPEIHSTKAFWINNPNDYKSFILLEHLPRCGLVDHSSATAHQLAEKMIAISTLCPQEMRWIGKADNELSTELLEQFIAAAEEGGYVTSLETALALEDMRRNWHELFAMQTSGLRLVPCHNDLHIENLGVSIKADRPEYVFFDWEKFGLNYLGSDLHHFITRGISEPDFEPFSEALRKRYREIAADTHGADGRSVDIAALSYSLFRCMTRSVIRRADKKQRVQLNHVVILFRRLRELACAAVAHVWEYAPLYV